MKLNIPRDLAVIYQQRREENTLRRERLRKIWIEEDEQLRALDSQKRKLGASLLLAKMQGDQEQSLSISEELAEVSSQLDELFALKEVKSSNDEAIYHCKFCKDTGIYQGKLCSCALTIRKKLEESKGISFPPPRKIRLDNFKADVFSPERSAQYYGAKASPRDVAENFHRKAELLLQDFPQSADNFYFYGKPGTGKTWLAAAIANELRENGYSVAFIRSMDFVDLSAKHRILERNFNPDPEELQTYRERMKFLRTAAVLILDDLGSERRNDEAYNDLISLWEARMEDPDAYMTIITGNLTPAEFARNYDERLGSRLRGMFKHYSFEGPDLRLTLSLRGK